MTRSSQRRLVLIGIVGLLFMLAGISFYGGVPMLAGGLMASAGVLLGSLRK